MNTLVKPLEFFVFCFLPWCRCRGPQSRTFCCQSSRFQWDTKPCTVPSADFTLLWNPNRLVVKACLGNDWLVHMTKNRLMVAFDSNKGPNLKVVKWCWKGWNGPILMHIYDKQCEIIQKNQWKNSNFQIQCFYKGTSGAPCWKRRKTQKLGKLKHPLLNFFKW